MRNLLILAKWLAGRANVDVEQYNGSTACIGLVGNRKVIKIPKSWSYTQDQDAAVLLEGVIDHEALGHGRFTDLEGRQKAEEAGIIKFNNLSSSIQNILEDVYIENMAIATYPGVKKNLAETVKILVKRGFFGAPSNFEKAGNSQLIKGGLLNILRGTLIAGQEDALAENVKSLKEILPKRFGTIWTDVLEIAMEVKNSQSTQDNILLTVRIMTALEQAAQQSKQSEKKTVQDSGDKCEDDDAQATGSSVESGTPDSDSQTTDTDQHTQGDQSQGDQVDEDASSSTCKGESNGTANASSEIDESASDSLNQSPQGQGDAVDGEDQECESDDITVELSDDGIDAAREILEGKDDDEFNTEISVEISKAIQAVTDCVDVADLYDCTRKYVIDEHARKISMMVKKISDELQDALITETRCETSTKFVGKSLNNRVLSRVKLGNGRVFRQKHEGAELSLAVSVLVDMSGSMDDRMRDGVKRLDGAIGFSLGLGDLLDEFDVPFEINCFSDGYAAMKLFSDDWTSVRKSGEAPYMRNGTHTGAAMQKALCTFVDRQEDRRLMIVLTDGDTSDLPVLFSCYAEAQAMEIEIASVMIGPHIQSIQRLADEFGFSAKSCNDSADLSRFVIQRILESI